MLCVWGCRRRVIDVVATSHHVRQVSENVSKTLFNVRTYPEKVPRIRFFAACVGFSEDLLKASYTRVFDSHSFFLSAYGKGVLTAGWVERMTTGLGGILFPSGCDGIDRSTNTD